MGDMSFYLGFFIFGAVVGAIVGYGDEKRGGIFEGIGQFGFGGLLLALIIDVFSG